MKTEIAPATRARTLLALLWRQYDAGGISMGRTHEAVLLEAAMDLLGPVDQGDAARLDAMQHGELVNETRSYLSALRRSREGIAAQEDGEADEPDESRRVVATGGGGAAYYEETVIDGVLHCRGTPNGSPDGYWRRVTDPKRLAIHYMRLLDGDDRQDVQGSIAN